MFIFNKMKTVDNHAEAMLREMEFEKNWRIRSARDIETQAYKIMNPEHYYIKQYMLDHACKLCREAMEISEQYYKLKEVMKVIHR